MIAFGNKRMAAFCAVALLFLFAPCRAAEWKEVFNPYQVLTLHLELSPADWDRVRRDQPSQQEGWIPQLAEARMWADGETPIRVQIRRKGESDIPLPEGGDPQKVSLKIDVNALVEGQEWRGLRKLSLENGSTDPLNEGFAWIAHRVAWEAGVYGYEAAYSGWVRLFVNGELKGVYINAEQRDAQFMRNHGYDKGPSSWLYKVDGSSSLEVGVGPSPTYEHLCFAPFNAGPGGGGGGGGRDCPQPNLEADLPQWINLRGFFTLGAVEAFLENRDGLFTHSGKNSYAVDFFPPFPNARLYFPWDQDTVIAQGNQSIYGNEPYQQQLLMHPWFRQIYEQLLRDLTDRSFSIASLTSVIDRMQAGIGAAFDEDPYAYGGNSSGAFNSLRQWVQTRVPNVRAQLTQPWLRRPVLSHAGGEVAAGYQLRMSAPAGTAYYTTDGTDPRAPGGSVSATARAYTTPVVIERTTHVIARAFDGTLWTPLPVEAAYNIARYANALRITELMYHAASGGIEGDEENYEFIELKNTGAAPMYLAGYRFDGLTYAFPAGTILQPNTFWVIARSQAAFAARYPGVILNGIYTGRLDNDGEKIRVQTSDGNTARSGSMPDGEVGFETAASAYNSLTYEPFDLSARANLLRVGGNVLAVEVHQASATMQDLAWDGALTFDVSNSPTLAVPTIAPSGGTFFEPQQIAISHPTVGVEIFYTLNGIDPDRTSIRYSGPFTVATTTDIRARAYAAGFNESAVALARISIASPTVSVSLSQQTFEIQIVGAPNADYIIESSLDLASWPERIAIVADRTGIARLQRSVLDQARLFFRIRAE